jgi:hypothetical protein
MSSFEFKVHQTDMYEGRGKGLRIPKLYLRKTVPRDLNGGSLESEYSCGVQRDHSVARWVISVCVCVCVCVCVRARAHALLGPCYEAGNDVCQRISFL